MGRSEHAEDPADIIKAVLPHLYRSMLDDAALSRAMVSLRTRVGGEWGGLIVHRWDGASPAIAATDNIPESAQRAYAAHFHRIEPWREAAERAGYGFGVPALSQDMVSAQAFRRTEFYSDFWRQHSDLMHTAGNVFALDNLHYGQIALPRRCDMGPYPNSTRRLLASLTPYLAACLKARMQLDLGRERARLALGAFEAIPQPLMLLSLPGRAIALNAAAQQWLSASRCLSLRHGRWFYRDAALRNVLRELLESIPHPLRGYEVPMQSRVYLDGEWQDLQRLPVVTADTEADPGAPVRMLLIIHRPEEGAKLTARQLQTAHGLTDAERAVCALLLLGLDARQIALSRNTRRETARSQIKAIYAKLGVAGHAGLLVLARTLNAPG